LTPFIEPTDSRQDGDSADQEPCPGCPGEREQERDRKRATSEEEEQEMHDLVEMRDLEGGRLLIARDGGEQEEAEPPEEEGDPGEETDPGLGEHVAA